jgi:hypothetical protein
MPLHGLDCGYTQVTELSALVGMPLMALKVGNTKVSDLSPINSLSLTDLECHRTQVSDLSPVRGAKLTRLFIFDAPITDLSPLEGMNLLELHFTPSRITTGIELLRKMASLQSISTSSQGGVYSPAEFWRKYDAGEFGKPSSSSKFFMHAPAFPQWVKGVQAMPAEQQIEAVRKKLMELNPGFDGKLTAANGLGSPRIVEGLVTQLGLLPDKVTDLSPVRALPGLRHLNCSSTYRRGRLADLSPLAGMQLSHLLFKDTQVADLSPLRGMPLLELSCGVTKVADLSPLYDCRSLERLHVGTTEVTAEGVAALQKVLPNCKIEWNAAPLAAPTGAGARPKAPEPAAADSK